MLKEVRINFHPELRIYRGLSPGDEKYMTTVSSVTSYMDTGVTNGKTYYYEVSAITSNGTGTKSNEASAVPEPTTIPTTIPGYPMGIMIIISASSLAVILVLKKRKFTN